MKFLIILIISNLINLNAHSVEVCSRIATVNYQEIIVDTSSTKKGEGLRYYLEKDKTSLELLNEYQEKSRPSLWTASFSTIGSLMVLSSFALKNNNKSSFNKTTLLLGGALIVGGTYFASQAAQKRNEVILQNAVDQYNKRNSPKIFFSPLGGEGSIGVGLGYNQEF